MIAKCIGLIFVCGSVGWGGLFPNDALPTPYQLRESAKQASVSAMCKKKPKSKMAKDLCKRWKENHNG
jgi:hypothetical protein